MVRAYKIDNVKVKSKNPKLNVTIMKKEKSE